MHDKKKSNPLISQALPSSGAHCEPVALVAHEWNAAREIVSAYVGSLVRNQSDREDVLQQTALYLIEHAADYQGTGFLTWAIGVAKFRILELWRRNKYDRRMKSLTDVADAAEKAFLDVPPPGQARVEALNTCLAELPPKHRQLVEQRYHAGIGLAELAEQWQRPVNTLAVILHRIRHALARCIEDHLRLEETP